MPYKYDPADNLHGFYSAKTAAFYKCVGHKNFSQDTDNFLRSLVLGLWKTGQKLSDDHVLSINSLYSSQPRPSYLYWELVTAVSEFKGIEVPEFFRVLALLGDKESCQVLIDFIRSLLMRLADPEAAVPGEYEYIAEVVRSLNLTLSTKNPLESVPIIGADSINKVSAAPCEKAEQSTAGNSSQTDNASDTPPEDIDMLMSELDSLIGISQIKSDVKSLINLIKVRKLREQNELPVPPISLHMVFTGNPGTGKTTVARLLSRLYHSIGILSTGTLVEVDRSGLVAGYVGQTAIKTAEAIKKAKGGILFIDEAYSLAPGDGENDFGREAIEILLKCMEDSREDLIVIAAGYQAPMERFIASNPGLESRFGKYFVFSDYTGEELFDIFISMCEKNKYIPNEEAKEYIKEILNDMYENRDENFGNARDVRNLFEKIISQHSDRIAKIESPSREDLMTFIKEDVIFKNPDSENHTGIK